MASEYKKRKIKSKYLDGACIKDKDTRLKGLMFYTPAHRHWAKQKFKEEAKEIVDDFFEE